MPIKLDNREFQYLDLSETNDGKNLSFKINVQTEEEKEKPESEGILNELLGDEK